MNKSMTAASCAVMGIVALSGSASASFLDAQWRTISPTEYELYAVATAPDIFALAAELNTAPPGDEQPTGLYSFGGVIQNSTDLVLGASAGVEFVPPTLTPFGDGTLLQATWGLLSGGVAPEMIDLGSGTLNAVRLLRVDVEPGTTLGGGDSSIAVGFEDALGATGVVYLPISEIPTPGTAAGLALLGLAAARRRR